VRTNTLREDEYINYIFVLFRWYHTKETGLDPEHSSLYLFVVKQAETTLGLWLPTSIHTMNQYMSSALQQSLLSP
jgi:hypothetical protein